MEKFEYYKYGAERVKKVNFIAVVYAYMAVTQTKLKCSRDIRSNCGSETGSN